MLGRKRRKKFGLLLTALAIGVAGVFIFYQNNTIDVSRFNISNERASALRIVHLSDLHGKQFGAENIDLVSEIVVQNPDLIVVTGDTIHYTADNLDEMVSFMGALSQRAPVVCISGNHEWRSVVRDSFFAQLEERGIIVLENEIRTLDINGSTVHVLGLDERLRGRKDISNSGLLLAELSEMSGLRVALTHYPQYYALAGESSYNQYDFDLMFAGHAHGGQWNLPFVGSIYAHGQGYLPPYTRGLYDERLLVSAGLGNSHFPLRIFNYPHLIVAQINE